MTADNARASLNPLSPCRIHCFWSRLFRSNLDHEHIIDLKDRDESYLYFCTEGFHHLTAPANHRRRVKQLGARARRATRGTWCTRQGAGIAFASGRSTRTASTCNRDTHGAHSGAAGRRHAGPSDCCLLSGQPQLVWHCCLRLCRLPTCPLQRHPAHSN